MLAPLVGGDLTGLNYHWSTGDQTPTIVVYIPGIYTVEVQNVCETLSGEVVVRWQDVDPDYPFVYVPNVFAPLSFDPDNAQFHPYFAPGLTLRSGGPPGGRRAGRLSLSRG